MPRLLVRAFALLLAPYASVAMGQADAARASAACPIKVVVPFVGGGTIDQAARLMLARSQGITLTVDNRIGNGSHFGAEVVAKSEPDGCTALFAPVSTYAAALALRRAVHYDLAGDFAAVAVVANAPHVLIAHPSLPVKSVRDLIALARARPGEIRWGTPDSAPVMQLELALFTSLTALKLQPVKADSTQLASEIAAGKAEAAFETIVAALPLIKSGKLRAIAGAGTQRSPALRDVPTLAESGLAAFNADYWYMILMPEGTSRAQIARLDAALAPALGAGELRDKLLAYGMEARYLGAADGAKTMQAEIARWARVANTAGPGAP